MFCDQIKHTVDRIRSPNRGARSSNNFDSINYGNRIVIYRIICTAQHKLGDLPTTNLAQKLLSRKTAKIPHRSKIIIGKPTTNMHTWNSAKGFNRIQITIKGDIFWTNDMNRGRVPPIFLFVSEHSLDWDSRKARNVEF